MCLSLIAYAFVDLFCHSLYHKTTYDMGRNVLLSSSVVANLGYITFSILNSAEHESFPAHNCYSANSCWHFNIFEQEKIQL